MMVIIDCMMIIVSLHDQYVVFSEFWTVVQGVLQLMNILVHIVYCQQRSVRYKMSLNRYIMTTAERVQLKMWLTKAQLKSSFSDLSPDKRNRKKQTNWLSLKRPLQQLNRTRNTYILISYLFFARICYFVFVIFGS